MLRKLVMILLAAAAAGPALANSPDAMPFGGAGVDPMAECDCQRYGYCPAPPPDLAPKPPPPPPPPPTK